MSVVAKRLDGSRCHVARDTEINLGPGDSVLHGDPAPPKKDTVPNFCPMSIVAKQSPISATAEHLFIWWWEARWGFVRTKRTVWMRHCKETHFYKFTTNCSVCSFNCTGCSRKKVHSFAHDKFWTVCHRVYYKSTMKCNVSFSQGSVSTLFRWGGEDVIRVCVNMFFLLTAVQKLFLKIKQSFSRVIITNVLPRFLWTTVYVYIYERYWIAKIKTHHDHT